MLDWVQSKLAWISMRALWKGCQGWRQQEKHRGESLSSWEKSSSCHVALCEAAEVGGGGGGRSRRRRRRSAALSHVQKKNKNKKNKRMTRRCLKTHLKYPIRTSAGVTEAVSLQIILICLMQELKASESGFHTSECNLVLWTGLNLYELTNHRHDPEKCQHPAGSSLKLPKQTKAVWWQRVQWNKSPTLPNRWAVCLFLTDSGIILPLYTSVRHSWCRHLTSITTMPGAKGLEKDAALITGSRCVQASSHRERQSCISLQHSVLRMSSALMCTVVPQ